MFSLVDLDIPDYQGLVVEPPDLGNLKLRINARPVDVGFRSLDLDQKIGVGAIGDPVGVDWRDLHAVATL